jgi:phosphoenolpyruvate carboxykinase (ATP)
MLRAALTGKFSGVEFTPHPVFGVGVPKACPDVPAEFLDARGMWADKHAYDEGARALAGLFRENFKKFSNAGPEIHQAGPRVSS